MTSSCNPFMELPDQLGYVQCSFCDTILLVSVPCSSPLKVVTVKCGHCACLLSVSLVRASFLPLQLLASLGDDDQEKHQLSDDLLPKNCNNGEDGEEDAEGGKDSSPFNPIVNKPPEKRQRAPSAYNRFVKEEIQRIKASQPNITHKEVFSTAAKNWAHFPQFQHKKGKGESCSNCTTAGKVKRARDGDLDEADKIIQGFREKEASRQSLSLSHGPFRKRN